MIPTILDTVTGEARKADGFFGQYDPEYWISGNGSCDCNRAIIMGNSEDLESGPCLGAHRYLIIDAEFTGDEVRVSLFELNSDYPNFLLEKHFAMPTPEPQAIKLPPCYDTALLGATVSTIGADRFVYSLTKLVQFKMLEHQCQAPEARQIVLAEVIKPIEKEHGPNSPVWTNDELVLGSIEDNEKPIIIVPEVLNGRKKRR